MIKEEITFEGKFKELLENYPLGERTIYGYSPNEIEFEYWYLFNSEVLNLTPKTFAKVVELIRSNKGIQRVVGIYILHAKNCDSVYKKETLQLYFELLDKPQSDAVLHALFGALSYYAKYFNTEQLIKLTTYKTVDNIELKSDFISMLCIAEHEIAVDCIIELTYDPSRIIRRSANIGLCIMADCGFPKIREALWKGVSDPDEDVKWSAILGLSEIGDERIIPIIIHHLETENFHDELFEAICMLKDEIFVDVLRNMLTPEELAKEYEPVQTCGWRYSLYYTYYELIRLIEQGPINYDYEDE